jgi:hypothetical protein
MSSFLSCPRMIGESSMMMAEGMVSPRLGRTRPELTGDRRAITTRGLPIAAGAPCAAVSRG